jgi:hypothetical protein
LDRSTQLSLPVAITFPKSAIPADDPPELSRM